MVAQKDNQYNQLQEQSVTEAQQLNGLIETRNNTISLNTTTIASLNETITQKEAAYVTVVAERDARPTLATYNTAVAESRVAGQGDVTSAPASYNLITQTNYNTVVDERNARFVDTDEDGITDVKEGELETDTNEATVFYLQDAYDFAVNTSRLAGQADVTANPQGFELTTVSAYNNILAQRDARPTRAQYDVVVADRDERPTIGEVKDARLGSVVLQPDGANNNITIRFSIEETDDFKIWTKRDEINEVTVPLELGSKFYRFAFEDE
jgi:hypothetical protein